MKTRTITAVIALLLFLPIVIMGSWPLLVLVYLMAITGLYEILKMNRIHIFSLPGILSLIALCMVLIPQESYSPNIAEYQLEIIVGLALIMLSTTVVSKNRFTFVDMGFCVLAVAYIGIGFMYFFETREAGLIYILYALLIVWLTDSGAYILGKAFGRRKLWPQISPNKTIEGSVGGTLVSVIIPIVFVSFGVMEGSLWLLIPFTIVLSIFGQMGDLVESALKRHFDVKDSGTFLPGHGGILDRFDSFIFVLPLMNILPIIS
ncbi:phosphatidate cytidylyltransferase [Jeotgalicoccus aerolatus]|jgi:phosphatidate cytidylyltransferase|uniref:Phosphatidate cytidylyltransferase n=1 Tax=Jeotgalicoccus aerolatus TaxID=709510 RepID=A0A1G8WBL2_9STAP|nr:phosphatidate cytidylyltransferase [Jeotgalicoccus aerolatus]NMA82151.1 phosphatidate cytidylyltransferase [Jeotgalicoccus aerolatus]SDJ75679.1 phosphatidate cytidylyltransferase [Jeotgalicoccus aerolatus]HJG32744.1 phosphatidate cytidylyltransferase [Jeotgalicoccus aerolatus]